VAWRLVGAAVAVTLALHLIVLVVTPFGIHRDEFLYLAMGRHLRFWHMDFPPLIALLARLSSALFGHTLAAVRVFPACEGAVVLVLGCLIARELGGGRFAQGLVAVCLMSAGLFLRPANLFHPVVLDQLWWTLALYCLVRLGREPRPRWWIGFGVAAGLGLLTKFSILFLGFSALVALLVSPQRRWLLTPWPWLASALAFSIGSPSIVGQVALGFPVVEQMRVLQGAQLAHVTWFQFVAEQPMMVGPVPFLVAVAGAVALVLWGPLKPFVAVGRTCIAAFLLLLLLHGKSYYIGPVYPTLFAAGGVWLEHLRSAGRPWGPRLLRGAVVTLTLAVGLVGLPITLPLLPPAVTGTWAVRVGGQEALRTNTGDMDRLPQDFADMLGWEQQAQALARVVDSLGAGARDSVVVFAANYGEAAAAEFYRPRYRLPPVVCVSGSYWFFGPGTRAGAVLISIGLDSSTVARYYDEVRPAGVILSPWSVEEERRVALYVTRRPHATLQALWPGWAGIN
jgi:hypothetical protein